MRLFKLLHTVAPQPIQREKDVPVADTRMIGTMMMSNQCRGLANSAKSCPGL